MVKVLIGDLFESRVQTLVNTVNCVGIMGKGIALEFKKRFPDMFRDYVKRCNSGGVRLGCPYLYKPIVGQCILNFPTKDHWRSVTSLQDIINGLEYLLRYYKKWGIKSIAVPPLGCGYGQLEWRIVGPSLYRYLKRLEIPVELYAPHGTSHEELQPEFLQQDMQYSNISQREPSSQRIRPAWVALVDIIKRLEDQPFHWPVGRTIFQKIAYVATEEGLPTGLEYQKSSYGPFSKDLKNLIVKLLNNGLIQEERLGRMFKVSVGPTFADARKEYAEKLQQWDHLLEKTTDLFMRMKTNQAELVATVLFTYKSLERKGKNKYSELDVVNAVLQWKKLRRPKLDESEIALTVRNLAALDWIHPKASPDLPLPKEALFDI